MKESRKEDDALEHPRLQYCQYFLITTFCLLLVPSNYGIQNTVFLTTNFSLPNSHCKVNIHLIQTE